MRVVIRNRTSRRQVGHVVVDADVSLGRAAPEYFAPACVMDLQVFIGRDVCERGIGTARQVDVFRVYEGRDNRGGQGAWKYEG